MADNKEKALNQEESFKYNSNWRDLMKDDEFKNELKEDILENYIIHQRWYGAKSSTLKYIDIIDHFEIENEEGDCFFGVVVEVNFKEAFVQNYFLPVGLVDDQIM